MLDEVVCDASVAVKCLFDEDGSAEALELVRRSPLIAPDFILVELASVAATKVKRGEAPLQRAALALTRASDLFAELTPAIALHEHAFALATLGKISVYDALYLALAEKRGLIVMTADQRLVRAAMGAGLEHRVRLLINAPSAR